MAAPGTAEEIGLDLEEPSDSSKYPQPLAAISFDEPITGVGASYIGTSISLVHGHRVISPRPN